MEDHTLYQQAKEQVEARIGFGIHFGVYLAVNVFLLFLDLRENESWDWSYWTLMGWGIGVLFHGLSVFVFAEGSSRKERMIEREMERRRGGRGAGGRPS